MTDQEILQRLNLSDADATDLIQKLCTLNEAQVAALSGCVTQDIAAAAASIGQDCSTDDLQRFLDARKADDDPGIILNVYFCQGDQD